MYGCVSDYLYASYYALILYVPDYNITSYIVYVNKIGDFSIDFILHYAKDSNKACKVF